MCAVSSHDYAPSRAAYRATRLWLSPVARRGLAWGVPLAAVLAGIGWMVTQPQTQKLVEDLTAQVVAEIRAQPELQIHSIGVHGASPELDHEIRKRLGLTPPVSWFDLDRKEIAAKITELDAVEAVTVAIEMGGALSLHVLERSPSLIWRTGQGLELIDETGHRIAFIDRRDGRSDLPLIAGEGAPEAAREALDLFAVAAPIEDRLRGLVRVGERRWDVILTGDQRIMLPEASEILSDSPVAVLERVIAWHEAHELLDRDVSAVDMRNPKRPTLRLGEAAYSYQRTLRAFQNGQKDR